jgi:hypothetical protein
MGEVAVGPGGDLGAAPSPRAALKMRGPDRRWSAARCVAAVAGSGRSGTCRFAGSSSRTADRRGRSAARAWRLGASTHPLKTIGTRSRIAQGRILPFLTTAGPQRFNRPFYTWICHVMAHSVGYNDGPMLSAHSLPGEESDRVGRAVAVRISRTAATSSWLGYATMRSTPRSRGRVAGSPEHSLADGGGPEPAIQRRAALCTLWLGAVRPRTPRSCP